MPSPPPGELRPTRALHPPPRALRGRPPLAFLSPPAGFTPTGPPPTSPVQHFSSPRPPLSLPLRPSLPPYCTVGAPSSTGSPANRPAVKVSVFPLPYDGARRRGAAGPAPKQKTENGGKRTVTQPQLVGGERQRCARRQSILASADGACKCTSPSIAASLPRGTQYGTELELSDQRWMWLRPSGVCFLPVLCMGSSTGGGHGIGSSGVEVVVFLVHRPRSRDSRWCNTRRCHR